MSEPWTVMTTGRPNPFSILDCRTSIRVGAVSVNEVRHLLDGGDQGLQVETPQSGEE